MKNINRTIALTLLTSMIGAQTVLAQSAYELPTIQAVTPSTNAAPVAQQAPAPFNFSNIGMPAPLKGQVSVIPAGTSFNVKVNDEISSKTAKLGQIFVVNLSNPLVVNGKEIIPAGSEAVGQVTYVKPAARMATDAQLEVKFTKVKLPNGQIVPVMGKIATIDKTGILKGGSVKSQLVKGTQLTSTGIAGGALTGLTIGAMASHATAGTIVGTSLGGVIGLGWFVGKKGKEIILSSGTDVVVSLEQPLTIGQ